MPQTEIKTKSETIPGVLFAEKAGAVPRSDATQMESQAIFRNLRMLWEQRRSLSRALLIGILFGTLLAFILPTQYRATTQLMPPDIHVSLLSRKNTRGQARS